MRPGRRSVTLLAVLGVSSATLVAAGPGPVSAEGTRTAATTRSAQASALSAAEAQPKVTPAVAFGESAPASELPKAKAPREPLSFLEAEDESLLVPTGDGSARGVDPALQQGGGSGIPPTSQNFDGINIGGSSSDGVFVGAPPDTDGDVGPNHYLEAVNTTFAVYSKKGELLSGPTPINALWESSPNAAQFNCTANSRGDPIVQYDPLADRWLISQFNFPGVAVIMPPFDECIAISQGPDPTGPYFLYDFHYSNVIFNDYPKFGVWPDAYYMSVNQFVAAGTTGVFRSAGACAYEREKMLVGDPNARQVCFDESVFDPGFPDGPWSYGGQLPSDLDGNGIGANFESPPPPGSPNYFLQALDSTTAGQDKLLLFKFHVDWANPANSWFGTGPGPGHGKPIEISVADFESRVCGSTRNCVPQQISDDDCLNSAGEPTCLDALSDRLMYRLAYRNFGTHESLVANHTVEVGDAHNHAGIRWYEVRDPGGTPTVHQQSTWAPDGEHRWMGSIGMDKFGGIALGYSLSSRSRHPAVAYAARRATDPPGQLSLGEGVMFQGSGSQVATQSRWGDYSSMHTDPNGCTFWYAQEYYPGTGSFNWATRIGSFTLPNCGDPQLTLSSSDSFLRFRNDLTYTITVQAGENPALGATVRDELPEGVSLLSAAPSRGTCTGLATVVCNLGDLPARAVETITLTVYANQEGTLRNTATLSTASSDSDLSNNSASVETEVFNPCVPPGFTRITDPTGDATGGNPAHDVQSVSIAEPDFGPGVNKLHFTLKMASLAELPPSTTWPVTFFYGKNASGADQQWFVAMKTGPAGGPPTFRYGTGTGSTNGIGALDAESGFDRDGTINLVVSNSKIAPASGGNPSAGQRLTGFLTRIRLETQTGSALVPDNAPNSAAPDGDYQLEGSAFCANAAPTAVLGASPTSGFRPLTVAFNASGSSDPDGDAIESYTFRFGDGSTPVTQTTPTISHTYQNAGTYQASLTVRDSRGRESTNPATVAIQVNAAANLSVVKSGPATGRVGQALTYTIRVTNTGPDAANGVVLSDTLPKNAGFGSASASQGSCAGKPHKQVVTCSLGTLARDATATVTLVIKPTTKGAFTDVATATATSPGDPVATNNTSRVTTQVGPS